MALGTVTRTGILTAIQAFDRLGREQFLRQAGFGRSRAYLLEYEGRLYDSKAIVGYAHEAAAGEPLTAADFSGGDETVARLLERLGFTVRFLPNPSWTRDEIILACALTEANGWKQLDARDPRVIDLSNLLRRASLHATPRHPDFRNPAGVARKTHNLVTAHPGYIGKPSNGNRLDKVVVEEFVADPATMRTVATEIRELLAGSEQLPERMPDVDWDSVSAAEGSVVLRQHLHRERDPNLRRQKIAQAKRLGAPVACEVCGFDFGRVYGDRGVDYIECHHRLPLHVSGKTRTRLNDLAMLCSNCHRMIHRTNPWLTVEELRALVERNCSEHQPSPQ